MNSLENQREVTVMTRLRCYLGKHKWESRQDSWGETLDVRLLRQATHTPAWQVRPTCATARHVSGVASGEGAVWGVPEALRRGAFITCSSEPPDRSIPVGHQWGRSSDSRG